MAKATKLKEINDGQKLARKIGKVLQESNTTAAQDILALAACLSALMKAYAKDKDLEVARNVLDGIKSQILNDLSANGWE